MTTPERMTPQERLVQAVNDAQALALILGDTLNRDDLKQDYLARMVDINADRLTRSLAAWQKELSADDEMEKAEASA